MNTNEIKSRVKQHIWDGTFRSALCRCREISSSQMESLIRQALNSRHLTGRAVDAGYVRQALERAHWTAEEIDFLLYRSRSIIDTEVK